jgi:hypothetical protein
MVQQPERDDSVFPGFLGRFPQNWKVAISHRKKESSIICYSPFVINWYFEGSFQYSMEESLLSAIGASQSIDIQLASC